MLVNSLRFSSVERHKLAISKTLTSLTHEVMCQVQKRNRVSQYADVNSALYQWYTIATSKNIYPNGMQLIAQHLGYSDFKASHRWLDRWKTHNNVHQMRICGESRDVSGETVESRGRSVYRVSLKVTVKMTFGI